jgi:hypothetical protein
MMLRSGDLKMTKLLARLSFVGAMLACSAIFVTAANADPAALGPVVGKGVITATPSPAEVGDQVTLTFANFPKTVGELDGLIVVPAGTPDSAYNIGSSFRQNLAQGSDKVGPFAPGTYEARWLTMLYNNDRKMQVGARTQFTVNP